MRHVLAAFALLLSGLNLAAREWTSSDGRKLEADFVRVMGDQVTLLRRSDGRSFTLPLARLSPADQAWIQAQGRGAPASGAVSQASPKAWLVADFERPDWEAGWNLGNPNLPRNWLVVAEAPAFPVAFPTGRALEITLKQGTHYGADWGYDFAAGTGAEPEAAVLSYRLCFAPDFNAEAVQGGKLPGFGGIYGETGAAGKRVDGSDSWSARGAYWKPDAKGDIPIGFYVYHADMPCDYGDTWYFSRALERGKWHDIKLAIRLNTPASKAGGKGRNDGVLRGWVNGKRVFERRDIRFRDSDRLKIRNAWFHFYHGGAAPAAADYKLWIDDVVIAPAD